MKITFFTCFGFPQGTYFRWHNIAIGLQRLGHEVTVHAIGSRHWGRTQFEVRDGVHYVLVPLTPFVHRLLDSRLDPITLLRAMRHALGPADIYHVFQPFPHSCIPALFHRFNDGCLVFDWDDLWWGGFFASGVESQFRNTLLTRAVRFLEERMPRYVDGVTTCSTFLADAAGEHGATSTQIIHNGYWPGQPVPSKSAAREILGLDPQAFYFGFMGRTTAEITWCLDALAAKSSLGRKVRLALCGMPHNLVEELPADYSSCIDYLGCLTQAQTRVFARAIDCGLLPLDDTPFNQSRFPIKFAEYLASGAHVAASAVGEFARLAKQLRGVTLAGLSRDSWRVTLSALDLDTIDTGFDTSKSSVLAQMLDWEVLSRQLEEFYFERLRQKKRVLPPSPPQ